MTVFVWKINQMDRLTSNDFVVTCHYIVTATDDIYTASTYGTISYTQEEGKTYIPYADLTEAICVDWIKNSIGQETVEASLQSQIDLLKNPIQKSGLAWAI